MSIKLSHVVSGALVALSLGSVAAMAAPISQGMFTQSGQPQYGTSKSQVMSRSGRYIIFTNPLPYETYLRDIKTQTSILLNDIPSAFALSPSGRYAALTRLAPLAPLGHKIVVLDRVTNIEREIQATTGQKNLGLSDNGYVLYIKGSGMPSQLIRLHLATNTEVVIASGDALHLGYSSHRNPLSADGNIALFRYFGDYKIYNAATQQITALNPVTKFGVPVDIDGIDLASNGKFIALYEDLNKRLHLLDVAAPQQVTTAFDLSNKNIDRAGVGELSVSGNGRFISFFGKLMPGHPEWAAANALDPNNPHGYPRIFRYDTWTDSLATISTAHDGSPLVGSPTYFPHLGPIISADTVISDDGSMVELSTSSHNIVSTPLNPLMSEANYHVYLSNGFSRNYQFVDMPNSDIAWKAFAPMTLVGNNLWEGTIAFDGVNDSFKFDAGGQLVNGKYTAVANWGINFGAGAQNIAVNNGSNIAVTGGAGNYKITFNDQTLAYSITKVVDVRFNCFNGVTTAGQNVFAVGSIPTLGNWLPAAAVKLTPGANYAWSGTMSLPANSNIEWKCIKRDDSSSAAAVVWEAGANNQFNSGSTQTTDGHF